MIVFEIYLIQLMLIPKDKMADTVINPSGALDLFVLNLIRTDRIMHGNIVDQPIQASSISNPLRNRKAHIMKRGTIAALLRSQSSFLHIGMVYCLKKVRGTDSIIIIVFK